MAQEKEVQELVNVDVDEISLVDKGANKKKFYLFKRDNQQDGGEISMAEKTQGENLQIDKASISLDDAVAVIVEKCKELEAEKEKIGKAKGLLDIMASNSEKEEVAAKTKEVTKQAEPEAMPNAEELATFIQDLVTKALEK